MYLANLTNYEGKDKVEAKMKWPRKMGGNTGGRSKNVEGVGWRPNLFNFSTRQIPTDETARAGDGFLAGKVELEVGHMPTNTRLSISYDTGGGGRRGKAVRIKGIVLLLHTFHQSTYALVCMYF